MRLLILLSILLTISGCGGVTAEQAAKAKAYCTQLGMDLYVRRYDDSDQASAVYCRAPETETLWKIPDSVLNGSGRAHF